MLNTTVFARNWERRSKSVPLDGREDWLWRQRLGCGDERSPRTSFQPWGSVVEDTSEGNCDARYDFSTGMWCGDDNTRCEDFSGGSASEQPKQSITTWCGMPVCCNYTKGMPGRADRWVCSDGGSAYRSEKLIGCGPAGCPGGPRGHPDHR